MGAFGFSLNNLSMFGLVLSIGIVIDDAIVVVENVERHIRAGISPREAAHLTMDEVGGALIGIALVLVAVFVPTAFMGGIAGQFYKQFALTIAAATVISLVGLVDAVAGARGATPEAACSGRPAQGSSAPVGAAITRGFDRFAGRYGEFTRRMIRMSAMVLIALCGAAGDRCLANRRHAARIHSRAGPGHVSMSIQLPPGAAWRARTRSCSGSSTSS